ncbi:MAG: tetratricopeptide repeat protein [Thiobacillus sp.]|nr:tetratricopeptide repeat protein [Thiobacillus sp.]
MNAKPLVLILALASLTACAQSPVTPAKPPAAGVVAAAPVSALSEQILYQFLLGEIAGQRGDLALANEAYSDLAYKTRDPAIVRRAAEIATYGRDIDKAVRMARLWVELEPASVRARQFLVTTLLGADHLDEVKPHLEALLRLDGRPVGEGFLQLHGLLARYKDKMAVLGLMKELAGAYPAVPEAQLVVGQSALNAGQHVQAVAALDRALSLKPDWETAALVKGQALARQSDEALLTYWKAYTEQYPAAERVRLAYAKALAKAGRYAEARQEFDVLVKAAPDNPDLRFAVGLLAMQMNDLDAAEAYLVQTLEHGFGDVGLVQGYLGQINEGRQRYEKALEWYLKVEPSEHYFQSQLKAGVVLGKLGRVDEGRGLLHRLETDSDAEKVQVIQAEAQLLREAKRYQDAYVVLGEALAKTPDSGELLYDHAMIAERLDKLDVLEADLRRLIKLEPEHAHAYNALGYTLVDRTTRLEEGIALLEKALKLSPEDPFILDSMGWAQFKAKRPGEAVAYLKRAYERRADPEIAAHLGEALWAAGQREEAGKIWQVSLREYPDNDVLKETVSRYAK